MTAVGGAGEAAVPKAFVSLCKLYDSAGNVDDIFVATAAATAAATEFTAAASVSLHGKCHRRHCGDNAKNLRTNVRTTSNIHAHPGHQMPVAGCLMPTRASGDRVWSSENRSEGQRKGKSMAAGITSEARRSYRSREYAGSCVSIPYRPVLESFNHSGIRYKILYA
ncbi:hypothetical protein ETH_00018925 [Eimeria tenella]|uniref:Uncharacterized protein n=1 Tax=Eimeria tenella TaxID=5802 RepID=U6KVX3_EIMTE|nr:hypothetical protein ETH_00018925 [Eimeria tenella]CDJ41073.1 hypothetical protein ETH_00018925 [Eimeria tenella]|eukprot:XP_013231823.1 hypothetical protein ETH_00018925 [Eimeria tenella]